MNAPKPRALSIENRLAGVLKPIAPRRGFVRGLGHRIKVVHAPAIVSRITSVEFFLLILAGVFSLGMLLALLARIMNKRRTLSPQA